MKIPMILIGAALGGLVALVSSKEKETVAVAPVVTSVLPDAVAEVAPEMAVL